MIVSQAGQDMREQGPGESVGEIALLYDVPRTASVRALEPVEALTLSRDDFLGTLCGQTASRRVPHSVALVRRAVWPTGGG